MTLTFYDPLQLSMCVCVCVCVCVEREASNMVCLIIWAMIHTQSSIVMLIKINAQQREQA